MKTFLAAMGALALATAAQAQQHDHGGHGAHAGHAAPAAAVAPGVGVVKALDARAGTITIAHEPIKALNWGAMTMAFKAADPALLRAAAVGDKVSFQLKGQQLVALRKQPGA